MSMKGSLSRCCTLLIYSMVNTLRVHNRVQSKQLCWLFTFCAEMDGGTVGQNFQLKSLSNHSRNFERLYAERRIRGHFWKATKRMTSLIVFSEKQQMISGWSALEIFNLRSEAPLYPTVLYFFLGKDELLRIFIIPERRLAKYKGVFLQKVLVYGKGRWHQDTTFEPLTNLYLVLM